MRAPGAGGVRRLLLGARRALRAIAGAPDYDRYVEHVRAHHPGREPVSRAEFERQRISARYDSPGSKCC
ncbi:MAG TPA: YbdD/YjiX family protein [Gemmatimonadaceae bacterium]|nr:YbdD/YjiX family protein [Gemmatimonadaceae bacterium]